MFLILILGHGSDLNVDSDHVSYYCYDSDSIPGRLSYHNSYDSNIDTDSISDHVSRYVSHYGSDFD